MAFDLLIRNTSELVTCAGSPTEPAEKALGAIARGALGVTTGRVAFAGAESALPADAIGPDTRVIDAGGGFAGPGFVDCHTHLVFAGERSAEFEARARGATYLEIAAAGGGIMSTVRATRAASEDALVQLALPRLRRLLSQGVTLIEIKSGYGLNVADELKMLRAIRRLQEAQSVGIFATLLCAHAVPEELAADRQRYVRLCVEEIIPSAAEGGWATFCDAFVERSAFTLEEGRRILEAGKQHGLVPRIHADQLSASGGARLAAELGAASADHLEFVDADDMRAMALSGTSAVLVPTSTFFLRQRPYAPGRALRDAGLNVALATNVNPGSAMSESVGLTMSLACLENGLTPAEAYWGFTRGAALALRLPQGGRLAVGDLADAVVFSSTSYRHLPYHLAVNHAVRVIKDGRLVYEDPSEPCRCE
jgi:imidazolonepropionase